MNNFVRAVLRPIYFAYLPNLHVPPFAAQPSRSKASPIGNCLCRPALCFVGTLRLAYCLLHSLPCLLAEIARFIQSCPPVSDLSPLLSTGLTCQMSAPPRRLCRSKCLQPSAESAAHRPSPSARPLPASFCCRLFSYFVIPVRRPSYLWPLSLILGDARSRLC